MAKLMLEYLESQPQVWRQACQTLPGLAGQAAREMQRGGPVRRVVMVGSGSSHYAAQAAACLLEQAGGPELFAAVPTRLGQLEQPAPGTVYWVVSQSGKSTSTQAAAERLRAAGARVWAVTGDEASPLARCAGGHLLIPCGEERVGPKTKGMTCTLLALWLLGRALAGPGAAKQAARQLEPAFAAADRQLALCRAWAAGCAPVLAAAPCLTLVADGPALPLAREGALKLLETLYVPAAAWEFEEYLHGVNNIIGPGAVHLFLLRQGPNRERMQRLVEYCRARGAVCLVVDCDADPCVDGLRLGLGCQGGGSGLPYQALLPFQMLSALGSEAKGIDCDHPRYPDFYAALGTKAGAKAP